MEKILHNGRQIEIYESIEEMPVTVFQNFNRFLLIDAGVGGDIESVDTHLARLSQYFKKGDTKNFSKQIRNLRQNIAFAISRTNPKALAFGALVYKVNGKKVRTQTDDDIQKLIERLGTKAGLPYGIILQTIERVKKKWKGKFPFTSLKKSRTAGKGNF
jgi:hypothetical protein